MLIHSLETGCSIPYPKTCGSPRTPPPPPHTHTQFSPNIDYYEYIKISPYLLSTDLHRSISIVDN